MFELLGTPLLLTVIFLLAYLIIKMYNFERSLPDFAQIFDNLGGDISETFKEIVTNPTVKASFTAMGKKSGEVRASAALKNKVADKAIGQNIVLKKALEYLDISPIEGLQLLNDPTIGPTIRGLMATFEGSAQGLLGGLGGGGMGRRPQRRNDGNQVPNMS